MSLNHNPFSWMGDQNFETHISFYVNNPHGMSFSKWVKSKNKSGNSVPGKGGCMESWLVGKILSFKKFTGVQKGQKFSLNSLLPYCAILSFLKGISWLYTNPFVLGNHGHSCLLTSPILKNDMPYPRRYLNWHLAPNKASILCWLSSTGRFKRIFFSITNFIFALCHVSSLSLSRWMNEDKVNFP